MEAATAASGERQIVAMTVGGETYGIGIDLVHTIILEQAITAVPRTPEHVKGIINLRGRVVPIIDLRIRFALPPLKADRRKDVRIVMVDVDGLQTGLIVDGVSEVLRLSESNIEAPSEYVASESAYVEAIARTNDRLILLLDVNKVLATSEDLHALAA